MAAFYNQATHSYGGNTVISNTTEAKLLSRLEIAKRAIGATYTQSPAGSITTTPGVTVLTVTGRV